MFYSRNSHFARSFLFTIPIAVSIALSACGSSPAAPAATAVPAPTEAPEPTAAPTAAPTEEPDTAITSLDDVSNAVIYIEVDGGIVPFGETATSSDAGSGSGFIIDPSGIAVTNNHVVTGAGTIKVFLGGTKNDSVGQDARILGISECSDLAVIQLLGGDEPYPYLKWYEGEIKNLLDVVAFGFPLSTPSIDTTPGSITQVDADGQSSWASLSSVLEHNARLNPGNSGGPLVTEDAEVVGINYAGNSKTNQYFSIGRDQARDLIDQLREGEDDTSLGINGEAFLEDSFSGIWVRSVKPGSPASKSGLKPGDVITSMYNTVMAEDGTMSKYCQVLRSHPNEAVNVEIYRPSTGESLMGEISNDGGSLQVSATEPTAAPEPTPVATYTDYQTVTHTNGSISVEVPVEWADVYTDGSWSLNDEEIGISISAFQNSATFQDWTGPGVYIAVSRSLVEQGTTPDQLLDMYQFTNTCTANERSDYDDGVYVGRYDYWTDCSGFDTELYVVAFQPADGSFLGMIQIQATSEADDEAVKRIVQSFQAEGNF